MTKIMKVVREFPITKTKRPKVSYPKPEWKLFETKGDACNAARDAANFVKREE